MRVVIYGAGAVGGTIGGCLAVAGTHVELIARGAHLDALQTGPLTLRLADTTHQIDIPAHADPESVGLASGDVVVLAMKTQDTEAALQRLEAVAPHDIVIVCAQNGVENERLALRRFSRVLSMVVMLPAAFLEPGAVENPAIPVPGILDLGPTTNSPVQWSDSQAVAAELRAAGFWSEPTRDIMRWNFAKLRMNAMNALDALCGRPDLDAEAGEPDLMRSVVARQVRAEVDSVVAAAGIDMASRDEMIARRADFGVVSLDGKDRPGGSSWQSLARGAGSIEADHLNGEIVLLGRQHGVPTPANEALRRLANTAARHNAGPGSLTLADVEAEIARLGS